jgi:hypothetical protein
MAASNRMTSFLASGLPNTTENFENFLTTYWHSIDADKLPRGVDYLISLDYYSYGKEYTLAFLKKMQATVETSSPTAQIHLYTRLKLSFFSCLKRKTLFNSTWIQECLVREFEAIALVPQGLQKQTSLEKEISLILEDIDNAKSVTITTLVFNILLGPLFSTMLALGFLPVTLVCIFDSFWSIFISEKRLKSLEKAKL